MSIENKEKTINTLIIVCCHAIYVGADTAVGTNSIKSSEVQLSSSPPTEPQDSKIGVYNECNWLIEPFQQGEVSTFVDHVRTGVEHLAANPNAILCFSGGATKPRRTAKTESQGYKDVAEEMGWFGKLITRNRSNSTDETNEQNDDGANNLEHQLADRVFNEEWATDSYQNVLLSLIQYPIWAEEYEARRSRLTEPQVSRPVSNDNKIEKHRPNPRTRLPQRLIIVSHAFKHNRFAELHLPAIRSLWEGLKDEGMSWEIEDINTIGSNPPFDPARMKEIEDGDRKRGYGAWKIDLHGTGELLSEKRKGRGWDQDKFLGKMNTLFGEHDMEVIRCLVQGSNSAVKPGSVNR